MSGFRLSDEQLAAYYRDGFVVVDQLLNREEVKLLGDIARAEGMTRVAHQTGLGRESLYKALSPTGNPELATALKVVEALGIRFQVVLTR